MARSAFGWVARTTLNSGSRTGSPDWARPIRASRARIRWVGAAELSATACFSGGEIDLVRHAHSRLVLWLLPPVYAADAPRGPDSAQRCRRAVRRHGPAPAIRYDSRAAARPRSRAAGQEWTGQGQQAVDPASCWPSADEEAELDQHGHRGRDGAGSRRPAGPSPRAVPPVARTSSMTSTRSPGAKASRGISSVASPYSSAYDCPSTSPGQLARLAHRHEARRRAPARPARPG